MKKGHPSQAESRPSLLDLAEPVSERVEIKDVLLIRSSQKRSLSATADRAYELVLVLPGVVSRAEHLPQENLLRVELDFQLQALRPDDRDDSVAFEIQAGFLLLYELAEFEGLTQEKLEAFANLNGVFNAWPFWREYVRDVTGRMGFDPVTIPVRRVSKAPKPAAAAGSPPAAARPKTGIPNPRSD